MLIAFNNSSIKNRIGKISKIDIKKIHKKNLKPD